MSYWKQMPARLVPAPGVVDICRTSLSLPQTQVDIYRSLLSDTEARRAERFRGQAKSREYIISRGLLRKVLGITLGCNPEDIDFHYSAHDKPCLAAPKDENDIRFNVSHSHEQTLIALTPSNDIGVDIEHLRTNLEFKKMASRFFSVNEADELNTYTDLGIAQAFFACWTRKEAFVKALGEGIAFGLSEFSVSANPFVDEVRLVTHWDESFAGGWSIRNINAGRDYVAAIAVAGKISRLRFWDV